MVLKDRLGVLIQAAEIAQKRGALSLDDAVYVKKAIDCIHADVEIETAIKILLNTVQLGQSKGCYSLKDAHLIYVVSDGIEDCIPPEKDKKEEETGEKPEK